MQSLTVSLTVSEENTASNETQEEKPKRSLRDRFVRAMLGPPDSETAVSEQDVDDNYETHDQRLKFLEQTPFMYKLLNINALIVCAVCVFLYGFFY